MVVVDEPDLGTQAWHHHLLVFHQYVDSPSVSGLRRIQYLHPGVRAKRMAKTYNSGYSLVVTHLTTNPPVRCLNRAERTGSLVVSCSLDMNALDFSVSGNL
jgi:hypothetical protein